MEKDFVETLGTLLWVLIEVIEIHYAEIIMFLL